MVPDIKVADVTVSLLNWFAHKGKFDELTSQGFLFNWIEYSLAKVR